LFTKYRTKAAKAFGDVMDDLDFDCCVADYGYGKDRVSYLVSRFPGKVYGCFYQEDSKLIIPAFSDAGFKVSVDRTAA